MFRLFIAVSVLLVMPAPPPAHADMAAGRNKAQQQCAVCHGIDGIGTNPEVPNLAGESQLYIEKQLKAFRSGERQHQQMSIVAEGLSDEDIRDLAAWYSALKITVDVPN